MRVRECKAQKRPSAAARKLRRRLAVPSILLLASLISLAGCARAGRVTPAAAPPLPSAAEQGGREVDWNNPWGGLEVTDVNAALPILPFSPRIPSGFGEPATVRISDPELTPRSDEVIWWLFKSNPSFGVFAIKEEMSQTTQSKLESLAGCDAATGCVGNWSIVTIRDGTRALLIEGPTATSIVWLQNQMMFTVMGPTGSFSGQDAIDVAETV